MLEQTKASVAAIFKSLNIPFYWDAFGRSSDTALANIPLKNGEWIPLTLRVHPKGGVKICATDDHFTNENVFGFLKDQIFKNPEELRELLTTLVSGETMTFTAHVRITFKTRSPQELGDLLKSRFYAMMEDLDDTLLMPDRKSVQFGVCRMVTDLKADPCDPSALPIDDGQPEHDGRMARVKEGRVIRLQ